MPLKQKNLKITINYLYKIITQNNIKFGRSQYLINNSANLFVFRIKNNMEFFDIIDLKNILYKIFLYVKTLYLINKKSNNFLFATTTPVFSEIMKNAAFSSNTIYHIDR
jgi:ribosomal protein S2